MRVYSQSQKKFIDQPDNVSGGVGSVGSSQNGGQTNQLQQILGVMALRKGDISGGAEFLGLKPGNKKEATTLRKEFSAETKNLGFETLRNAWKASSDSKATDLSIVYSYIKTLDPTSVVREGEINLTKAQESVGSNIARIYKRVKQGGTMSPKVRQEMVDEIGRIYNDRAGKQQELNAFYSGLASDSGLDPKDVIGKIGEIEKAYIPEPKSKISKSPNIGGVLGGVLGGAGGFMAGGPVGAAGGAVAGYGAGGASQEMIEDMLGKQSETSGEQLSSVGGGALKAGAGAYTLATLKQLLLGGGQAAGGVTAKGGLKALLNPRGALAEKQKAAAVGKVGVNTKNLIKAGEQYAKSDPRASKLLETFKPAIESAKDAPTLLERMKVWSNAYTQANKVGKSSQAGFFDALYKAAGQELKTVAPEAAKARTLLGKTYSVPRQVNKLGMTAIKASALGRLLGLGF